MIQLDSQRNLIYSVPLKGVLVTGIREKQLNIEQFQQSQRKNRVEESYKHVKMSGTLLTMSCLIT